MESKDEMNIAFFLPNVRGGGAERSVISLVNELAGRGKRLSLVLCQNKGEYREEISSSVTVIELGTTGFFSSIKSLAKVIADCRLNVLVSGIEKFNIISILACRLSKADVQSIVVQRNNFIEAKKYVGRRSRPYYYAVKWLYPYANQIIALNEDMEQLILNKTRCKTERVTVIGNGFPVQQISEMSASEVKGDIFKGYSGNSIAIVGRLFRQKDHMTLIEAFAEVSSILDCRLLVIGKGPEEGRLRQRVDGLGLNDRVFFLGFQANPYAIVARCDLLVLSSLYEGFPRVIVEALAVGTEVVATDCVTGPREILDYGRFGTLTPVGDAKALAQAMETALAEKHNPEDLKARAHVFSIEAVASKYLNLFDNLVR